MPNSTKIEEAYKELLEELLEEDKKLEKINKRIEKFEILERVDTKEKIKFIKRIETEILDETKVFEETETKLRKVETTIMKKAFERNLMNKKH